MGANERRTGPVSLQCGVCVDEYGGLAWDVLKMTHAGALDVHALV